MDLTQYAWEIADLCNVSRADLHIALCMFLENVRLGYAKYKSTENATEPDYASLKEEFDGYERKDLCKAVKELLYVYAADHSDLVKDIIRNDQESFDDKIIEDFIEWFPDTDVSSDDDEDTAQDASITQNGHKKEISEAKEALEALYKSLNSVDDAQGKFDNLKEYTAWIVLDHNDEESRHYFLRVHDKSKEDTQTDVDLTIDQNTKLFWFSFASGGECEKIGTKVTSAQYSLYKYNPNAEGSEPKDKEAEQVGSATDVTYEWQSAVVPPVADAKITQNGYKKDPTEAKTELETLYKSLYSTEDCSGKFDALKEYTAWIVLENNNTTKNYFVKIHDKSKDNTDTDVDLTINQNEKLFWFSFATEGEASKIGTAVTQADYTLYSYNPAAGGATPAEKEAVKVGDATTVTYTWEASEAV